WVDRAPPQVQPYLRLMRLDRPIGTWLLFWPGVFGMALAEAFSHDGFLSRVEDWKLLVLFGVGAIVMRGAGCTYNDIVDRDIDAQVERTRGRPIPSGAVTVRNAFIFLGAQCLVGLVILLTFNLFTILLGVASLLLIAAYPFMKRITWWPQAWLGLTFNWGALMGFAALEGRLAAPAYVLYAGCFFWTLGYDTIYAHQDKEDDALIGVKSTARLFGEMSSLWITGFYLATFVLISLAGVSASGSWWAVALMLPAAAQLFWQAASLRIDDPATCLTLFRANRESGLLIALALAAASYA
ncbi:MAG TPA: 4-hydroxybenzoate octaprenyltransferase, partial [Rhizomicrobium sp.]|nr:4-hydroxybenzoate octaprenyltransferase [Rhizomicrobium sp.]